MRSLLLSGNTECLTASTSGLCSLTSNSKSIPMSDTSVVLGLSHSLEILSHGGIELIGNQLRPGSVLWVLLSIQEPFWDVVLSWSGQDVIDNLDLIFVHFSASQICVNLGNFENENRESSSNTSNLSQTEWSFLFTSDVCVLHSENVLEFRWI